MRFRRQNAFTVIEILVYIAISAVIMALLMTLFNVHRQSYNVTTATYLLGQEAEAALRWIREDVRDSALASIRVYPSAEKPTEPPGASLASARNKDEEYKIDKSGAPAWEKQIFYTFEPETGGTGRLLRREVAYGKYQPIPTVSDTLPSAVPATKQRVVLRGVVKPDAQLKGLAGVDTYGGFKLQFVRSDDTLTSWSPSDVTWGKASVSKPTGSNTKMMDCQLIVLLEGAHQDKPSFVRLGFRLTPRF